MAVFNFPDYTTKKRGAGEVSRCIRVIDYFATEMDFGCKICQTVSEEVRLKSAILTKHLSLSIAACD